MGLAWCSLPAETVFLSGQVRESWFLLRVTGDLELRLQSAPA